MTDWVRKLVQGAFFVGLDFLIRNDRTRRVLSRMVLGVLLIIAAIQLVIVAVFILLGSAFFYLSNQTSFALPALWAGLLAIALSFLAIIWGSYIWRRK